MCHVKHIAAALYTSGSEAKRKEVFEKLSFDDNELIMIAENLDIPCHPEHPLDLLGRITTPGFMVAAIGIGIKGLFEGKHTECIDPLLKALEGKKDLKYEAIRTIFNWRIYCDETWVERYYDHPAITFDDYAWVLVWFILEKRKQSPVFVRLFNEADQGALQALLNDEGYKRLGLAIRRPIELAIKHALLIAKSAGSRHSTEEKAKLGKRVVDEVTSGATGNIKGPSDIIAEYAGVEEE